MIGIFKSKPKVRAIYDRMIRLFKPKIKARAIYDNFMFWPEIDSIVEMIITSRLNYIWLKKDELGMFKDEQGLYRAKYKNKTFIAVVDDLNIFLIEIKDWNEKIKPELVFRIVPEGIVIMDMVHPGDIFVRGGKVWINENENIRPFNFERKIHQVTLIYDGFKKTVNTICNLEMLKHMVAPLLVIYDGRLYSGVTWTEIDAPVDAAISIVKMAKKIREVKK